MTYRETRMITATVTLSLDAIIGAARREDVYALIEDLLLIEDHISGEESIEEAVLVPLGVSSDATIEISVRARVVACAEAEPPREQTMLRYFLSSTDGGESGHQELSTLQRARASERVECSPHATEESPASVHALYTIRSPTEDSRHGS